MNEILYHTKFLDLKSTPSKSGNPWYYAHRPNAKNVVYLKTQIQVFFPISPFRIALALFYKERHAFYYLESYYCMVPQGVQTSGMPDKEII